MNSASLGNLTLLARTAYAIMCFERYAAAVYPEKDFRPVAKMMWQIVDGSKPLDEACGKLTDIIPDCLFEFDSYETYKADSNACLTAEQYSLFTGILNADDPALNSLIEAVYDIAIEYAFTIVKPGAPETLPYLQTIIDILEAHQIALPDPDVFAQYAFPRRNPRAARSFNWMGNAIDPALFSLFDFTGGSSSSAANGNETSSLDDSVSDDRYALASYEGNSRYYLAVRPDADTAADSCDDSDDYEYDDYDDDDDFDDGFFTENNCEWKTAPEEGGCIITGFRNIHHQQHVSIPAYLGGQPVVSIEDSVFCDTYESACRYIVSLTMPDTIRQIGDNFFRNAPHLRLISMSAGLIQIGNDAFRGASELENLTIGNNCKQIGSYFCADAASLRVVSLGTAVEMIGDFAFYGCKSMTDFRCDSMLKELGYGSFWSNRWADKIIFSPGAELLCFAKDYSLLYRYVKRTPPARLFFESNIRYVYDFAFGGDAWHDGGVITDIYLPGAEKIGLNAFRGVPNATVHLSSTRMQNQYGPDYRYTVANLCKPAAAAFDLP